MPSIDHSLAVTPASIIAKPSFAKKILFFIHIITGTKCIYKKKEFIAEEQPSQNHKVKSRIDLCL